MKNLFKTMKIACVQPKVGSNRKECYDNVEFILKNLIEEVPDCDIACLPERWTPCSEKISENFQEERGDDYRFVKGMAEKYGLNMLSGGIWEKRSASQKPAVTCYFFNHNGEELGRQDKIHLYSYERGMFKPGNELTLFKLKETHFAVLICFDVAFYETPRIAAENGADLIFSPTQIREEGLFNWDVYLKARALENRIPIAACNMFGSIQDRRFIGKSKIISFLPGPETPSRLKVKEGLENESGYIWDDIDLLFPKKLRTIRIGEKVEKEKIKINKMS